MKKLILLFTLFSCIGASAQYNLKFKIEGLKDTTVFLARYLGDRLYYADTAEAKNGSVQFNKEHYDGGVYAVICPGPKYFEIILAEKNIEIETSLSDFISTMKVKKSEENKLFYDYIKFINLKKPQSQTLIKQREGLDKDKDKAKIEEINSKLRALDEEVKKYQKDLVANHPNNLTGKLINMSIDPIIPEDVQKNDTLRYQYYKAHYWDNIDLKDKRLVHSPVFNNKLEYFFKKLLLQDPDTICEYSHNLINQIEEGSEMFKFVVHYITYNYETSKIMGMDGVFVCMAESYYCPPDNSKAFWLKEDKLKELCERKTALQPLLIGKQAPRIILADTTEENWIDFYTQVNTEYTALIFWADDCGHCKKEMPKLKLLYDELKSKNINIEFVAVGTSLENDKWRQFIREKNLNWINISDFPHANENPEIYLYQKKVTDLKSLNFRKTYDIFSTPQIYLLDKDKKIVAKRLDAGNLARMIEHKLNIKLDYKEEPKDDKKDDEEDSH